MTATSESFMTTFSTVNDRKKVECCMTKPVPQTVLIAWDSPNGSRHEKTIQVAKKLPREFNPRQDGLIFQIDDRTGEVRLSFEIWYEKYRTKEVKPREN